MASDIENSQTEYPRIEDSLVQKFLRLTIEPSDEIEGAWTREQVRFLSLYLLVAIPILLIAQIITDLIPQSAPVYSGAALILFLTYIMSRAGYIREAIIASVICQNSIPFTILLSRSSWDPNYLPRITVWLIISFLIGSYLLGARDERIFISLTVLFFTLICYFVYSMEIIDLFQHIATLTIISVLILVGSATLERYIARVMKQNTDLKRRKWELEVYAALLRHDLRNDLQAINVGVELSSMIFSINEDMAQEHLQRSLAVSERIIRLIDAFSTPSDQVDLDFVSLIKRIAANAERTFENITICVESTDEACEACVTASRLLPMVFDNLFRNAAQHGGEKTVVTVSAKIESDDIVVSVEDNGPGIAEEDKEWLFKRGKGEDISESGLGLYLTRIILESHGGSIELVDPSSVSGAHFLLKMPIEKGIV